MQMLETSALGILSLIYPFGEPPSHRWLSPSIPIMNSSYPEKYLPPDHGGPTSLRCHRSHMIEEDLRLGDSKHDNPPAINHSCSYP